MNDETYRRRILLQLNRHEGRHSLSREVAHGRRGEIRQRYREGQEDQLGALGLVVNVIGLWNTLHTDVALEHLRAQGQAVNEALAALWDQGLPCKSHPLGKGARPTDGSPAAGHRALARTVLPWVD